MQAIVVPGGRLSPFEVGVIACCFVTNWGCEAGWSEADFDFLLSGPSQEIWSPELLFLESYGVGVIKAGDHVSKDASKFTGVQKVLKNSRI